MLVFVYLFSLLLCFNLVIVVFFFYFSFPPQLARLFHGQGSMVMICIQSVLVNLKLNLNMYL